MEHHQKTIMKKNDSGIPVRWGRGMVSKRFGRSTEAGLKAEKQNVADALLSFMYGSFEDRRRYEAALNAITDEEKKKVFMEEWQDGRTSMKNIGEYAHQLGEKLKGKVKCCIDDTTKVDT